ncbi:LuxR C-terminal-related transcriptional regulator [Kitasatospora sp. NPDC058048]|uniref:RNA polymerase sigma factor n=1 Tax=Kitasatospora sp. NPDC058048 TaxID=3346313 RepID=UPI0036DF1CB5
MATPPTADSPTPERHRRPALAETDPGRLLRKLTPREAQTLAHLAAGHDLPRTAATLGVTPTTARSYLQRAMRKLGTRTAAEALALLAGTPPRPQDPGPTGRPANLTGLDPADPGPAPGAGLPPDEPVLLRPVPDSSAPATPGSVAGADRPRADAATDGEATGKRSRTRAGKPAPGPWDGTRRTAPAEQPRQAADGPPADGRSAAPGRAQEPRTPGDRPGSAALQAPPAAVADDGRRQPTDTGHPPTAPGDPDRHGGLPGAPADGPAWQASAPAADAAGGGGSEEAPAGPAAGHGDTPHHAPAAPEPDTEPDTERPPAAEFVAPTAVGSGPDRNAPPEHAEHSATAAPAAPVRAPAAPERDTEPDTGPDAERPPAAEPDRARTARTEPQDPAAASPGRAALAAAAPSDADDDLDAEPPAMGFDELYETAHTRLVQQVFLLTACRHRAVHCVRRAFGEARRCWGTAAGSGNPEGWVRARACELALSPWHRGGPRRAHAWGLPHRRIKVRPADETQAVLPDHDRLTDRDRALLKALKRLSRPQRRALVLHDGLGLPAVAVAVEVESTLAAAEGRVWAARAALAAWVPDLVGPDPAAPGFADGLCGLLHRAAVRGCPEPHRTPVPVLRARYRLRTASRTGAAALLTVAVGGATLATLAGVRPAELFRPTIPPTPTLCLAATAAQAAEPAVPLLPDGAPNGITSIWCSPAPGLEAVLVDPQPQAVARWELPPAARGAAPPPQGPAACRQWSPLPCTTGPGRH